MRRVKYSALVVVLGFVSACGKVMTTSLTSDASLDGEIVIDSHDAPPDMIGPVKVQVLSDTGDGIPVTTARVLFLDANGQLVLDKMVDANGRADADMAAGGSVTAIYQSAK